MSHPIGSRHVSITIEKIKINKIKIFVLKSHYTLNECRLVISISLVNILSYQIQSQLYVEYIL
jgi:hypothetical protein